MSYRIALRGFLNDKMQIESWPTQHHARQLALGYLRSKFHYGRVYSEERFAEVVNRWHSFGDPALLKRGLFDSGLFDRTSDGRSFWRMSPTLLPEHWKSQCLRVIPASESMPDALERIVTSGHYISEWDRLAHPDPREAIQRYIDPDATENDQWRELFQCHAIYRHEHRGPVALAGVYHGFPDPDLLVLPMILVDPAHQRQGIASEYLHSFIGQARFLRDYRAARVLVALGNLPAIRLFASVGFDRIVTVADAVLDDGSRIARMVLECEL